MRCVRCGNTGSFYMQQKGAQTGLYCKECLRWQKWVGKKDIESYRRRGVALISPTASIEPSREINNIGVEGIETNIQGGASEVLDQVVTQQPVKEPVLNKVEDMKAQEKEIEMRVQARLEIELGKMKSEYESKLEAQGSKEEEKESEGCSFCRGESGLDGEDARVEVGLYSGLMAITTKNGETVQGFFPVNYCLKCGKKQ